MSRRHELKVDPEYMTALLDGSKPFEVRRNDRGYQRGDVLVLRELLPAYFDLSGWGECPGGNDANGDCTKHEHRKVERVVSYVYSGDPRWPALQPGYVVLGLAEVADQ